MGNKSVTSRIFEFFFYQIYCWYWLVGPTVIAFSIWCEELRLFAKERKDNKSDANTVLDILKNMGTQSFQSGGNTVFYVEPPSTVKAYIIPVYIGRDYNIPEIDYKDTLSYLLNRGCLLICFPFDLSEFENEEVYALELKKMLHFLEEKYKTQKAPVLLIGRILLELACMSLLTSMWEDVDGMTWLGAQSRKRYAESVRGDTGLDWNNDN